MLFRRRRVPTQAVERLEVMGQLLKGRKAESRIKSPRRRSSSWKAKVRGRPAVTAKIIRLGTVCAAAAGRIAREIVRVEWRQDNISPQLISRL
jgi:hypothetical protein